MISSPADTLFSVVSAPVFLFVGHGVGQNAILAGKNKLEPDGKIQQRQREDQCGVEGVQLLI